jgi:hypothetical protein
VPLYAGVYFSVFLALYNVIGAYAVIFARGILIPLIASELRKIGNPKEVDKMRGNRLTVITIIIA